MCLRQAVLSDLNTVKYVVESTISEVYPHYYPRGAVNFFLKHHSEANIVHDIEQNQVFLCQDAAGNVVGTVTVSGNEIRRLFVLPAFQGKGYGTEMLDYAEKTISGQAPEIVLAASFPAKGMYLKRGYEAVSYHMLPTDNHDFLCYDVMKKRV